MTMHAHEGSSSHSEGPNDHAGRNDSPRHGRPSASELARLRLMEVAAYVSVDDLSGLQQDKSETDDEVSSETERKRKQRQEDQAAGKHHFNVRMPKDDPVLKETIKMVAATLIQDREFHRTLDELVCRRWQKSRKQIANSLSSRSVSPQWYHAERDQDRRDYARRRSRIPWYLGHLRIEPPLREIVDCAASVPGDAALIAKAARTGAYRRWQKSRMQMAN